MTERDRNNVTNYKFDELVSEKNEEQVQLISSLVLIAGDKWNRKLKDRSFTCWEASILQFNTRLGLLSPFFGFQLYRSQGRSMDESIRIPQLSIYELCLARSNWISLNIDKRQRHRVEEWNTLYVRSYILRFCLNLSIRILSSFDYGLTSFVENFNLYFFTSIYTNNQYRINFGSSINTYFNV